jgi:hypothetical protein
MPYNVPAHPPQTTSRSLRQLMFGRCAAGLLAGEPTSPFHDLPLFGPEDGIPVLLHVHNEPAALGGLLKCFDKLPGALRLGVIGIFAFTVGMVDDESETRARVVDRGVLQHRVIAVTVPTT